MNGLAHRPVTALGASLLALLAACVAGGRWSGGSPASSPPPPPKLHAESGTGSSPTPSPPSSPKPHARPGPGSSWPESRLQRPSPAGQERVRGGASSGVDADTPAAELPPSVPVGSWSHVNVPGYRRAHVVHAGAATRTALLYLHGVCGDVQKIRDWVFSASELVTTVALLGDRACEGTTRFKWSQDIELIHQLAQRALREVQRVRTGLLDIDQVIVFGYSQGATRAERLVQRYPEHYPKAILGGSPRPPRLERLRAARAVAIFGGELEPRDHLVAGYERLRAAGVRARLDELPGVGHGAFGAHSAVLMPELLAWLLEQ